MKTKKTINVTDSTWDLLTRDKHNLQCKTLEEVILKYRNIVTKISNDEVTKRTEVEGSEPSSGNNQELPENEGCFL